MKNYLFTVLCLLLFLVGNTQTPKIESLKQQLNSSLSEREQVGVLVELGLAYTRIHLDSVPKYLEAANELAATISYEKGLNDSEAAIGLHQFRIGNYEQAINLLEKILEEDKISPKYFGITYAANISCYRKLGNYEQAIITGKKGYQVAENKKDTLAMIKILNNYSNAFLELQKFEEAQVNYEQVVSMSNATNSKVEELLGFNNLGIIQKKIGNYDKAIDYYFQAIEIGKKLNRTSLLGLAYYNISNVYAKQEKFDKAIEYNEKAGKIFESRGETEKLMFTYEHLCNYHLRQKNYEKAFEIAKVTYTYAIDHQNKLNAIIPLVNMGNSALKMNNTNIAFNYYREAEKIALELKHWEKLVEVYQNFSTAKFDTKNFEEAYGYRNKLLMARDSFLNREKMIQLESLEAAYDSERQKTLLGKQQAELALQQNQINRQRWLILTVILIAALILALAFLAYRNAQQRKKTNVKLRQLDIAKSRFFTNISHELRTPLTLILGPQENALRRTTNKSVKEDLQLANSNSKKLLNLVNEIMDLSKLESGKLELKPTAVHFHNLLRRIFFAYESLAILRGIQLNFDYQISLEIWVNLDINKFEKIINNLLGNALKFTGRGGKVQLAVSSTRPRPLKGSLLSKADGMLSPLGVGGKYWIELSVSDTGKGIHPDDLPRVFDRFYQAGQKEESLQGGTGIGLALAKELSHLFKGKLTVESKLGEGTIFNLKLPLELTAAKVGYQLDLVKSSDVNQIAFYSKTTDYQSIVLQKDKPKILIVEDNLEMSRYLVQTLSAQYQCSTAMDGVEALEKLKTQQFDLITSDVMMPNMDGFTFLKKVHQRELFSHTPVIMLTARSLEEDKLKGFQLGVDDYITKPFSSKELMARIDNLLKNKKEREEIQKKLSKKQNGNMEAAAISIEQQLLEKAETLALKNLDNPIYKVADLAKEMAYSERQLGRIIKKLTGFPPKKFIRELRLQKAWQLLETRQFSSIAEVSFEVGIDNPSYFSKVFMERFGKKPSEVSASGF